jgi:N-acetylmuramoyl-L-alanine amidase
MLKVAVVVGHNSNKKGARALPPLDLHEFDYYNPIADIMVQEGPDFGLEVRKFNRQDVGSYSQEIRNVYAEVDEYDPDISIELHFNSADAPNARRSEVLSSGSTNSLRLAAIIYDELVQSFNRTAKPHLHVKTLQNNDRGYVSLHAGRAPAVIVEPFFGSNNEDCLLADQISPRGHAQIYLQAARKYNEA